MKLKKSNCDKTTINSKLVISNMATHKKTKASTAHNNNLDANNTNNVFDVIIMSHH